MQPKTYDLIRKLSAGAFGEVFLAKRRSDDVQVAIKFLMSPDSDNNRRFFREATLLHGQLENPHVVDLLDWSFEDPRPYIVMELCEGSLRSWVGQAKRWQEISRALTHAATGLRGIHRANGFHRDIKPDNLLITRAADGSALIKVADFGLARVPDLSWGPMTRSPWGTPGYIAPELMLGRPFDHRCDVFSLGVTGIELLTGDRDRSSLKIRPDAPEALRALLLRMTRNDPAERPRLEDCLSELASMQLVPASVPTATRAAPAPIERESGGGAALAGLGLLAGLFALATMNSKDANGRFRGKDGRFRSGRWG